MGVQTMKYRATGGCRNPKYKVLGSTSAHDHGTETGSLGLRSVTIVGGSSRPGWANIVLIEDLYGLKGLEFCQNPTGVLYCFGMLGANRKILQLS
jgi:hypothetical protein